MRLSLLLLLFVLTMSCGRRHRGYYEFEEGYYTNFIGGECGLHVTQDYFQVDAKCPYAMSHNQAVSCDLAISQFLLLYPQVDCYAHQGFLLTTVTEYGLRERQVEARRIRYGL